MKGFVGPLTAVSGMPFCFYANYDLVISVPFHLVFPLSCPVLGILCLLLALVSPSLALFMVELVVWSHTLTSCATFSGRSYCFCSFLRTHCPLLFFFFSIDTSSFILPLPIRMFHKCSSRDLSVISVSDQATVECICGIWWLLLSLSVSHTNTAAHSL